MLTAQTPSYEYQVGGSLPLDANSLKLKVNVRAWWRDRNHLSLVNRLSEFIETVLLVEHEQ